MSTLAPELHYIFVLLIKSYIEYIFLNNLDIYKLILVRCRKGTERFQTSAIPFRGYTI